MSRISTFHNKMNLLSAKRPVRPTPDRLLLRTRLILEEFIEFLHSAGCKDPELLIDKLMDQKTDPSLVIEPGDEFTDEVDMPGCAHELTDILVVTMGAGDSMGLKLSPCFDAIMDANMTKLDDNGKPIRRPDGKIEKGPNYVKPNISQIIYPEE